MHKKPKKYSVFSLIKNALSYHENWQRAWRDPEPKKEYDAIIVGGGGHGLATAFYLAKKQLEDLKGTNYEKFPICIAKTQYSFSTDPTLKGAPSGHGIPIREVRLSSGAEFIVVVCGEIMTMPGLPSVPAANSIHLNDNGEIEGLF